MCKCDICLAARRMERIAAKLSREDVETLNALWCAWEDAATERDMLVYRKQEPWEEYEEREQLS